MSGHTLAKPRPLPLDPSFSPSRPARARGTARRLESKCDRAAFVRLLTCLYVSPKRRWSAASCCHELSPSRRFLIHVLPDGFHRIRHYGLLANANRANNIALVRRLLGVPDPAPSSRASDDAENGREDKEWNACPCCGGRMIIVETFEPGCQPRRWSLPSIGLDSS